MNKKIISALVLACTLTLSGCGFTESGELMSGARKFIENGEYNKAMANLGKVLDGDESNSEARGMYYQALKLQKAERARVRHDYEQEIKELQELLNDNAGSAKIKSEAEDLLAKAQEAFKNQKKAMITRKENAKKTAEENKNKYMSSTPYGSNYQNNYNNNSDDDQKTVVKTPVRTPIKNTTVKPNTTSTGNGATGSTGTNTNQNNTGNTTNNDQ